MEKRKLPRPLVLGGLALAAVGLIFGMAWYVLFRVNHFSLEIRLSGESQMYLEYGEPFQDPGAEAVLRGSLMFQDGFDPGGIQLRVESDLDREHLGRYTLRYLADYRGWHSEMIRTVTVVDTKPPELVLDEDGRFGRVEAWDNYDGDISNRVIRTEAPGCITYTVLDSSGNPASIQQEVPLHDELPPQITLVGGSHVVITAGGFFDEPGFRAVDDCDGDLTDYVERAGEVKWYQVGSYEMFYTVQDAAGNVTTVTRTVDVLPQQKPKLVMPTQKTIYLTFDDGPGPYTKGLLDMLDNYGAKATFFVTDSGYEDVLQDIAARGHALGIHTVTHDYASIYASPEDFFLDMLKMQSIIFENTGVKTTLMRFPGGSSNTVSKHSCEGIMTTLTQAVVDAGYQYFDWNVDSDDAGSAHRSATVLNNVKQGVLQNPVSIVLQHDIHDYSVEAIEEILIWGLNNGYAFEKLTPNSPGFHHPVQN